MSVRINYLVVIVLIAICTSCNEEPKQEVTNEKVIAKIGDQALTEKEYYTILINGFTREDSAVFSNKTIEQWATDNLFYKEALTKLDPTDIDIDKQVEEYRKNLINYIYETKLIENNLDTVVNDDEIENYYNTYIDNFILKDNIVKVNYIKIPNQSKEINKIKKLINSTNPKEKNQLDELCRQNAENYFINDSIWLMLDELKREIPNLKEQLEYNTYKGKVIEFNDNDSYYYLKIKDIKTKNTVSPLGFEKQNIKTFIINSRKVKLIKNYKSELLEKAKKNHSFKKF